MRRADMLQCAVPTLGQLCDRLLERAVHSTEEELASGSVQADMLVTHKYAEDVPVTVRVDMGGRHARRRLALPERSTLTLTFLASLPSGLTYLPLTEPCMHICRCVAKARMTSGSWCCP